MENILSVGEAAELLGVTGHTVRAWAKSGRLVPCRVTPGRHRLFLRSDVEKFRAKMEDGTVGGASITLSLDLAAFRAGLAEAERLLDEWAERNRRKVVDVLGVAK